MSNVAAAMVSSAIRGSFVCMVPAPSADRGEVTLAAQDSLDRAGLSDRKNNDRHAVLSSKRERGGIHDFQVAVERFLVVEMLVALGARVAFGVRSIDAIDIGRLEDRIALHLGCAQDRGRVGGKLRITGTAGEDDDAIVVEMA